MVKFLLSKWVNSQRSTSTIFIVLYKTMHLYCSTMEKHKKKVQHVNEKHVQPYCTAPLTIKNNLLLHFSLWKQNTGCYNTKLLHYNKKHFKKVQIVNTKLWNKICILPITPPRKQNKEGFSNNKQTPSPSLLVIDFLSCNLHRQNAQEHVNMVCHGMQNFMVRGLAVPLIDSSCKDKEKHFLNQPLFIPDYTMQSNEQSKIVFTHWHQPRVEKSSCATPSIYLSQWCTVLLVETPL